MSRSLVECFRSQVDRGAHRVALRSKRAGRWVGTTWGEWARRSLAIAGALVAEGVLPGDRVAIFADTSEEWAIADMAILLAGAVSVPLYPTLPADQARFILEDSGSIVVFTDAERLPVALDASPAAVRRVVCFDGDLGLGSARVVALGAYADEARLDDVEARASAVDGATVATIVYTSGTSGPPKGAVLAHESFVFEAEAGGRLLALSTSDEQLLFLPLAHIFARVTLATQLVVGYTTSFATSVASAMDDMLEIEPTFFASVPRLFEKIYQVASEKAALEGAVREKLFAWAIDVGREASLVERSGRRSGRALAVQHRYADKIVLSKIRARFGKRLRFAISGGAPLASELAEWFHACGVLVLEGYGLTETTAAATVNRPHEFAFGSVGTALPGVEVRIADDGEIRIRGPIVMRGYWNAPDATAEAIDGEGFLHTGDVGRLDESGRLTITDRKKDIIVTAGGKNVAPQNVEQLLEQSPFVKHAVVFGEGRKYLVALVTLDPVVIGRWAEEHGKRADLAELSRDPEVRALVELDVASANRKLAQFETVKAFAIADRELTLEQGEVTPTTKVRRRAVYEHFRGLFDSLYDRP